MNPTPRLPPDWLNPDSPVHDWLSDLKLSSSSKKVYLSMLTKLSLWMSLRDISLANCTAENLEAFLDGSSLEKEHRYRYVRLIERLYKYLSAKNILKRDNPGSKAAKEGIGMGSNDKTQFLTAAQCDAVLARCARPEGEEKTEKERKSEAKKTRHWSQMAGWRRERDKAITAMCLFGGVKAGEGVLLSVNCVTFDGRLYIQGDGRIPDRNALLLPEGRQVLDAWLATRAREGLPGQYLFPANDLGTKAMHPATLYTAVHKLAEEAIKEAGLPLPAHRLSPQTLRNTYAARLWAAGVKDEEVMESMGILELRSMERLKTAVSALRLPATVGEIFEQGTGARVTVPHGGEK